MAQNSRQLPLPTNSDVVTHTVKVNGEPLSRTFQLTGIMSTENIGRIPRAKITLADGDPASGNFKASEGDQFLPGNEIEILLGYRSEENSVFKGVIVRHTIRARSTGASVLTLECRHTALSMTRQARSKYYSEMSDSDVMSEILSTYSLNADITDTSLTHAELVQFNTSDWDFILVRSEANGMLCNIDNEGIKIAPPDFDQEPALTLTYGATILEFDAEIDSSEQDTEINGVSWDPAQQAIVEVVATEPSMQLPGDLTGVALADVLGQSARLQHGGRLSSDEAQAWVDGLAMRERLSQLRGRITSQGLSDVKPGNVIKIEGMGARFNGVAFVSGVRHRVSEGAWKTDYQLGLDVMSIRRPSVTQQPAAGLLSPVHGLQVGLVTQLGEDPDGEARILVRLPVIDPDAEGVWARVSALDAGDGRGSFFLPEIGDEVILGFLNDDPRDPVVLGMLHSSAKPPPLEASDDNHEKGFVSRSGMKFIFNDDLASVQLDTPNGNTVLLSDDEGGISVKDENSNEIILSSEGITIKSDSNLMIEASGDVEIKGSNVTITADIAMGAAGGASSELTSDGTTTVKGSVVMIN